MTWETLCATWVIRRLDQGGGYLAKPGSAKSYVKGKAAARRFPSREAAQAECCENETPERL